MTTRTTAPVGEEPNDDQPTDRDPGRERAASQSDREELPGQRPEADVAVIVPTRNEAGNVAPLLARLDAALAARDAIVVFVDDSDDDTPTRIVDSRAESALPVILRHRPPGERDGGLGGAVVEGMRLVSAKWVVVMDGDLQHPPDVVPQLLATAERGFDLVVASRYTGAGDAGGLSGRGRVLVSLLCTWLVRMLFPRRLRAVSDPMSGFFAVRPAGLDLDRLRPTGYKILLEIVGRSRPLRTAEVPFAFQPRLSGDSKASAREGVRLLTQVLRLRTAAATRRTCGRPSGPATRSSTRSRPASRGRTRRGAAGRSARRAARARPC